MVSPNVQKIFEVVKKEPNLLRDLNKNMLMIFFTENVNPTIDEKAEFLKIIAEDIKDGKQY